jgi:hypothetical protein
VADRTIDTIRWEQIARELGRRGMLDDPGTFLFTDHWRLSAGLAMATRRETSVACFQLDSRSFTNWSQPQDWVGRDGIFVRVDDGLAEAVDYSPWFTRIESLATFPIVRAGTPVQVVRLYRCVNQTEPYQFGYSGPGGVPRPGPDIEDVRPALVRGPGSRSLR